MKMLKKVFLFLQVIITQRIPFLFLSVNFFIYLMTPIDSTNDQNAMRRVI